MLIPEKNLRTILADNEILIQWQGDLNSSNINHDSRILKDGDVFLAIKGEAHDGHKFIEKLLLENINLRGMIISVDFFNKNKVLLKEIKISLIVVEDTTIFLGKLGRLTREIWQRNSSSFANQLICITGSNGKTSTKDWISWLLETLVEQKEILKTQGNLNNQWGLPFTLLKLQSKHKLCVVEIGTNHPGEINYLTLIALPNFAIITSIGEGHIGFFQTTKDIAKEKSSIVNGILEGGQFIIPSRICEKEIILQTIKSKDIDVIEANTDFLALEKIQMLPRSEIKYNDIVVRAPLFGQHQKENFILALTTLISVSKKLGISLIAQKLMQQIKSLPQTKGRLNHLKINDLFIWDDSYNANPASFLAAINAIVGVNSTDEKIACIGKMGELGKLSEKFHIELLQQLAKNKFSKVLFISDDSDLNLLLTEVAKINNINFFADGQNNDEDILKHLSLLLNSAKSNTHILIKGSRSTKTERFITWINSIVGEK